MYRVVDSQVQGINLCTPVVVGVTVGVVATLCVGRAVPVVAATFRDGDALM